MPELQFAQALTTHRFRVEVAGTQCPVTKVMGLDEGTMDVIDQPDAGATVVHKIASGMIKFSTLTIERNVDRTPFDRYFKDWFSETFQLNGVSRGSSIRRNLAVIKVENDLEVMRFAVYGAFVTSSKFTDLEAGTSNLFKQTITMEHDGLERVV